MRLQVLAVVRLRTDLPLDRVDASLGTGRAPVAGDVGTIIHAHEGSSDNDGTYIVECVTAAGETLWVADVNESEVERVS
jgi:hypothetical protein